MGEKKDSKYYNDLFVALNRNIDDASRCYHNDTASYDSTVISLIADVIKDNSVLTAFSKYSDDTKIIVDTIINAADVKDVTDKLLRPGHSEFKTTYDVAMCILNAVFDSSNKFWYTLSIEVNEIESPELRLLCDLNTEEFEIMLHLCLKYGFFKDSLLELFEVCKWCKSKELVLSKPEQLVFTDTISSELQRMLETKKVTKLLHDIVSITESRKALKELIAVIGIDKVSELLLYVDNNTVSKFKQKRDRTEAHYLLAFVAAASSNIGLCMCDKVIDKLVPILAQEIIYLYPQI